MLKRAALAAGAVLVLSLIGLVGCAAVRLPNVGLTATGPEASPPVLGAFGEDPPVGSAEDWSGRRAPLLREAFAAQVYGAPPLEAPAEVLSRQVFDAEAFGGLGTVEEIEVGAAIGAPAESRIFVMLVTPRAETRVPVILVQTFCGNPAAFPQYPGVGVVAAPPRECEAAWAKPIVKAIFGSNIIAPPFEEALRRGYALAVFYAADVAPDDAALAEPALTRLTPPDVPAEARTGAVAAWAWAYSRVLDVLEADPRIDANRTALFGHSRNGKAALLAAALDSRVEATIALQPGTAGGSLQRDGFGETVESIVSAYPHWFAPAYRAYAGRDAETPLDQHQLLALIAPRPVLLGAARRDAWSDPHGAFRAAQGASPAYALLGGRGLAQTTFEPNLDGDVVFYMRPGLHGVHSSDWRMTLDFLDRKLPVQAAP